jgi:SAM-dependent methyltransferase
MDSPLRTVARTPKSPARVAAELFGVSWLLLFFELACIRWFPAHVIFLTFFTNIVLLACFLGLSLGLLGARSRRDYLAWTPCLLGLALFAAHGTELLRNRYNVVVDVGQASPQEVFFGAEHQNQDLASFLLPIEVVAGIFFLLIALSFLGVGQELGRALNRLPGRVRAYTLNIGGSLAGIVTFALCSWLQLSPLWWFLAIALGIAYFLAQRRGGLNFVRWALLALAVVAAGRHGAEVVSVYRCLGLEGDEREITWSPYYRIDCNMKDHLISVNLIGHQWMVECNTPPSAYALPYLLDRDGGGSRPEDVLIIGAGSGNDVSRALQWGAGHVDAVEIDPVIQRIGLEKHPDRPYQDPRVTTHIDDGRNFLRSTDRQYDLVIYALVDSLVLHSSYSNLRLESYLFTEQAFRDVKRCLKPGGRFVVYNFFRQGWLVHRLEKTLGDVFKSPPLVLALPYRPTIEPETIPSSEFTMFIAGDTAPLRAAFEEHGSYWLRADVPPTPSSPNGFTTPSPEERESLGAAGTAADRGAATGPPPPAPKRKSPGADGAADRNFWAKFGPSRVTPPGDPARTATDDWPFLYLRQPMLPSQNLRGLMVMAVLSALLLAAFRPRDVRAAPSEPRMYLRMFCLGAGFMLVETRAVVQMALLFGSTWMVNSIVFFAVLVMILVANLFVLRFRPRRLELYYLGLVLALAANALVPLDAFLGMSRAAQVVSASLLVFSPVAFAAVIFALSFERTAAPDRAIAANVAGAMLGGLAEYASMFLGFQYLMLVAVGFYLVAIAARLPAPAGPAPAKA